MLYGRNSQNQMVLVVMSIGRLHWNWNEAHQPRHPAIMNGRLISANTAPVPASEGAADQPPPAGRHRPAAPGRQPPAPSQQATGSANITG